METSSGKEPTAFDTVSHEEDSIHLEGKMLNTLSKRIGLVSVLAILAFGLGSAAEGSPADGMGLSFKLGGGLSYLFNGAGDIEKTRLGMQSYATDWVEPTYTSTFDWKQLTFLPDFRIEVLVNVGERFGIGLGTSYLGFTSKGEYSLDHDSSGTEWWGDWTYKYTNDYTVSYKLTAVPISLNFYYFFPLDGIRMYVYAGPSYYFGSLTYDLGLIYDEEYGETPTFDWDFAYSYEGEQAYTEKTSCKGFGFQGGFGLEIPLTPNLSFGIEATGRFANLNNWKGDWTLSGSETYQQYYEPWGWPWYTFTTNYSDSGSGVLYYDEWQWWYNDKYYAEMFVDDAPPGGSGIRNARQASINLNSVGILVSILIHI